MSIKALSERILQVNRQGNSRETKSFLGGIQKETAEMFNPDHWRSEIARAYEELNEVGPWPENLFQWLHECCLPLHRRIRSAAQAIDDAFTGRDSARLGKALAEFKGANLEALATWKEHEQLSLAV